ncbi:MAG: heme-binding domain-containing protein [Bacteroidia bacterium]|nr:heme-binding domain-containing protein [Bacteroidia bacterium]
MKLTRLFKTHWKKIALGLVVALVLIQFIPVDRSVPEMVPADDYMMVESPPQDVAVLIKEACYDCHSFETEYPWYSRVAPVSFWLQNHINGGRKHLNFSKWGSYEQKRKDHKKEECEEMVEAGEMPMASFTWAHPEARLSEADREKLVSWFKGN